MTVNAEFAAKMAALSAAFSQRTANDAAEFDALGVALGVADSQEHRARAQYLAHRLAGGSATFGLRALEEPASALEEQILNNASAAAVGAGCRALAHTIREECGAPDVQGDSNGTP